MCSCSTWLRYFVFHSCPCCVLRPARSPRAASSPDLSPTSTDRRCHYFTLTLSNTSSRDETPATSSFSLSPTRPDHRRHYFSHPVQHVAGDETDETLAMSLAGSIVVPSVVVVVGTGSRWSTRIRGCHPLSCSLAPFEVLYEGSAPAPDLGKNIKVDFHYPVNCYRMWGSYQHSWLHIWI